MEKIYKTTQGKIALTRQNAFDMINSGDSAFVENLTGRMRHGLKAHLR
jgi:hypothetical protein